MRLLTLIVLCLFLFSIQYAQKSKPDSIHSRKINNKQIKVDGELNEKQWGQVEGITNFTQRELSEGAPATEKTKVAILHTRKHLFVGIWCYDTKASKIIAKELKRDFDYWKEDNFEMIIDTYLDKRNGYLFIINPNGAKADAQVSNNGRNINKEWDGIWEVKTKITEKGWFAEIKIPFSTLKFKTGSHQKWGINFERNIRRKKEQLLWQGWSRISELEQVARAGTLTGLNDISGVKLLELKPYAIAGRQKDRDAEGINVKDLGIDLSYLATPTVKINMTVNPDFATAESDKVQVNLTRFSLFYPEKREFFIDGANFFKFDMGSNIRPFYSRRIGLSRKGNDIPILGGLRLMGKFGNSTVGGLIMQESKTEDLPTTNYSVIRWKQDVFKQSSIGFLATGKIHSGHFNNLIGTDFLYSTSTLFKNKNLTVGGAYIHSYTSDVDQRNGNAQRVFLSYPNDIIEIDASWERSSKWFNPEVGYIRRTNFQKYSTEIQFNPRPKFIPWIRNVELKPVDIFYYIDNETGEMQSFGWEIRPLGFATKSGEFIEFNIIYSGENLTEEFEIIDGFIIPQGKYWFTRYEIQSHTYRGRPLSFNFDHSWGDFYNGTSTEYQLGINWRINKHIGISGDLQRSRISLPEGDFTVNELVGRLNLALNSKLFGTIFAQWNDEDNRILLNFRMNWIPKTGTDLFLIINHVSDNIENRWKKKHLAAYLKFVWRFSK